MQYMFDSSEMELEAFKSVRNVLFTPLYSGTDLFQVGWVHCAHTMAYESCVLSSVNLMTTGQTAKKLCRTLFLMSKTDLFPFYELRRIARAIGTQHHHFRHAYALLTEVEGLRVSICHSLCRNFWLSNSITRFRSNGWPNEGRCSLSKVASYGITYRLKTNAKLQICEIYGRYFLIPMWCISFDIS